jgi:hypothetical protein
MPGFCSFITLQQCITMHIKEIYANASIFLNDKTGKPEESRFGFKITRCEIRENELNLGLPHDVAIPVTFC